MKKIRAILINAFCILFLNTCFQPAFGKDQKFKGDYSSQMLRTLWMACNNALHMNDPSTPAMVKAVLCDCVTDALRREISYEQFLITDSPTRQEMSTRFTAQCMMELGGEKPV